MTELPEIPIEEAEVGVRKQPEDQRRQELYLEPDLDIHILPEDPEAIAEREFNPRSSTKTRRWRLQRK